MGDGQGWAEEEVIETRTNGSITMLITVDKLREAVAKEYDCPVTSVGVYRLVEWNVVATALEKLLADEPKPLNREEPGPRYYASVGELSGTVVLVFPDRVGYGSDGSHWVCDDEQHYSDAERIPDLVAKAVIHNWDKKPCELTNDEIINKWTETVQVDPASDAESIVMLVRWAIAESRPTVCGPTAEEVWEWARECMCGVDKNLNAKSFRDWYDSRVLPTAEPQPRGVPDEDIVAKNVELTSRSTTWQQDRIDLTRWAIEHSRPPVCGPTAEEVWAVWHNPQTSKRDVFTAWYDSCVCPVAEVTAPLEREIENFGKELSTAKEQIAELKRANTDWCNFCYDGRTAKERIAELEEDNKRLKSSWKCQAGALQQVNADLESQLAAAKAKLVECEKAYYDVAMLNDSLRVAAGRIVEAKKRAKLKERWRTNKERDQVWVRRDDGSSEEWSKRGRHWEGPCPSFDPEDRNYHIPISKAKADAIRAGWKKEEGK